MTTHPSAIHQSTNLMMQLQMLIQSYGIENLLPEEITFLQLYFLEKLDIVQIAQLTGKEATNIQKLHDRFSVNITSHLQGQ